MPSLLAWLSRRSLRFLHALGALLGWAAYLLSASYRRRLLENARLAGVNRAERRAAVAEGGKLYMELPRLWLRPREQGIADPVRWQGAEHVEAALAAASDDGDLAPFDRLLDAVRQPYDERPGLDHFAAPAAASFTACYKTYCGT